MALKYRIAKLEDVDEKYRDLYTARDGAFYLDAEGAVDKGKLDEFRENNIALKKQMDELTGKYKDIDPEEARRMLEEARKAKDKKMIEAGKMEELLTERTAAMKTEYEKQIADLTGKLGSTNGQLEKLLVDNAIQQAAVAAGVRETAMEDVLLRGRTTFKVKDGAAVPVTADGKVIYGKDGTSPQSMQEWLANLAPAAPHLFKDSTGGGSKQQTQAGGGAKTMARAAFDALSPQAKVDFSKAGGTLTE